MSDTATMQRAEGAAAQTVRPNRFVNASAEHVEPFYDSGAVAAGTELSNIEVAANGYLAGILVQVDVTSAGNSATVALREDGPFNIISSIRLADINGANIIGPMSGYDWYNAVKYGGYAYESDARYNPAYVNSATGTGGTAGTQSFMMRIPVQINPRDAYGALPNMNAASTFKLFISLATLANAFATPPNGTVTIRVRAAIETWLVPQAVDGSGVPNMTTPPGLGTYQRWVKNTFTVANGANTFRLPNVSNMIRNLVFVYRNATPARNDTTFPDSIELRIDGYARDQIAKREIRQRMWERFGYRSADLDLGVYVWDWTHELDGKAGFETRELWLPTNSATRLEVVGTFGAAGTLDVLTNDVIVAGGDYRSAG
jgi:hypothetical protein